MILLILGETTRVFYDIRGQATSTKDWLLNSSIMFGLGLVILLLQGNIGIGTTSPWGLLSVNAPGGTDPFVVGSSTGTQFICKREVGMSG